MLAIIVLPSALASRPTDIVPEKDSGNHVYRLANLISRGVDALVTKVKADHRASKAHTEPAVGIKSFVEVSKSDIADKVACVTSNVKSLVKKMFKLTEAKAIQLLTTAHAACEGKEMSDKCYTQFITRIAGNQLWQQQAALESHLQMKAEQIVEKAQQAQQKIPQVLTKILKKCAKQEVSPCPY